MVVIMSSKRWLTMMQRINESNPGCDLINLPVVKYRQTVVLFNLF